MKFIEDFWQAITDYSNYLPKTNKSYIIKYLNMPYRWIDIKTINAINHADAVILFIIKLSSEKYDYLNEVCANEIIDLYYEKYINNKLIDMNDVAEYIEGFFIPENNHCWLEEQNNKYFFKYENGLAIDNTNSYHDI